MYQGIQVFYLHIRYKDRKKVCNEQILGAMQFCAAPPLCVDTGVIAVNTCIQKTSKSLTIGQITATVILESGLCLIL